MNYNKKYIDIKVALINSILYNIPENILDVSYSILDDKIEIQIVILEETRIDKTKVEKINNSLNKYKVRINILRCSRDVFNSNKNSWSPVAYNWLDYVLYSKSETL